MGAMVGSRLGPYEILEKIGAGGMGEVYRARDPRLGRDVAIKVLPHGLRRTTPTGCARFEQEARAVAALSHPNIARDLRRRHRDGVPYLVTELLDGETLRDRLARGPLPAQGRDRLRRSRSRAASPPRTTAASCTAT